MVRHWRDARSPRTPSELCSLTAYSNRDDCSADIRSIGFRCDRLARRPDVAIVGDIFKPDAHPFRDARFFHRHTVQNIGDRHRPFVVRDDDELRRLLEGFHDGGEPLDVGFVESRIDLVEDAERTRLALEDGHDEGDGRHRFFATAQE